MVDFNRQPEPDQKAVARRCGEDMLRNLLQHIGNPGKVAAPPDTTPEFIEISSTTFTHDDGPEVAEDGKSVTIEVIVQVTATIHQR